MGENDVLEHDIAHLQGLMAGGSLTSVALVAAYIERTVRLDRGPGGFHSIIEVNPGALAIARSLDRERNHSGPRGPLHGIPILLKDNIDTADRMLTTAGSLALTTSRPPRDADVTRKLRNAGAVLFGKANMSEWANFRSTNSTSGWSARGGQARNAYDPARNSSGSSSGSAVATSANLVAAAVGTETDGSIVSPSGVNGIVGVKPTVGLISRRGIIPIAESQDTAGPMTRTVRDAAVLLDAMAGRDPADPATGHARIPPGGYAAALVPEALRGARIGIARSGYFGYHAETDALIESAISELSAAGATIIDPADVPTVKAMAETETSQLLVLAYEFKRGLANYLGTRTRRPGFRAMAIPRTLSDVMAFNRSHASLELAVFGQELFELAETLAWTEDEHAEARRLNARLAGRDGLLAALDGYELDALVAPTGAPAWALTPGKRDAYLGGCSTPPAVSGYPAVTVPAGFVGNLPIGLTFMGRPWSERRLLSLAYAFEQRTNHRRPPADPQR